MFSLQFPFPLNCVIYACRRAMLWRVTLAGGAAGGTHSTNNWEISFATPYRVTFIICDFLAPCVAATKPSVAVKD